MKKLKEQRIKAGLTLLEVSQKLGFAYLNTIYQYESGKRSPTFETLIKLARLYNCTLNDFVDDELKEVC